MDYVNIIVFLALVGLGYGVGSFVEKRHYRSIEERERQLISLPVVNVKSPGVPTSKIADTRLVTGSAVISVDYFKRMLAGLRNVFGGKVKSYESLMDRARREALLRMKESAGGADLIINVRLETSSIGNTTGRKKKNVGCMEALAYGTAVTLKKD